MKKSDLKKILKPLVKECINEVLIEQGVLSNIVSEVARGLNFQKPILESRQDNSELITKKHEEIERRREIEESKHKQKLTEQKKAMLDSIGSSYNSVNLFEGTEPLSSGGIPGKSEGAQGPLAGVSPGDSGVDLSGLNGASKRWNALIK